MSRNSKYGSVTGAATTGQSVRITVRFATAVFWRWIIIVHGLIIVSAFIIESFLCFSWYTSGRVSWLLQWRHRLSSWRKFQTSLPISKGGFLSNLIKGKITTVISPSKSFFVDWISKSLKFKLYFIEINSDTDSADDALAYSDTNNQWAVAKLIKAYMIQYMTNKKSSAFSSQRWCRTLITQ